MGYIKALDGIRAFAVSLVVLFHCGYLAFGWVGVQVFFVLSGYLITSLLLRDKESTLSNYLASFYWRRSLRIFPLYFGVLLIAMVIYALFRIPAYTFDDLPFLVTYTTNFARLRQTDVGPA